MRVVWTVLALLFVAVGAVFGALNSDSVPFDFYLFQPELPKGAALLGAVLAGWLAAGLTLWLAVILPLRRRLARLRREQIRREAGPVAGTLE
jgi:lipopolysaccharide assembly protein A